MSAVLATFRSPAAWSMRTRFGAAAVALLCICAALFIAYQLRPVEATLFARPLEADQVAEIEHRLTGWGIAHTATADNVRVPTGQRAEVLARLSLAGLPHAHAATSADVLQSLSPLTPQSVLDAQARAGLEGDIARNLRGIAGVTDASVIVAPAQRGFFVDEASHDASASVRLTLDNEATSLSADAISGIRSYVAGAVPGLEPRHVAVVDGSGAALGGRAEGGGDRSLQMSIQSALDRAVGPGATVVVAHVDADPASTVSHEVKRTPLLADPIASRTVSERYHGKEKSYEGTRNSVDRGSDTLDRTTRIESGATKRRSIAVLVDVTKAAFVPRIRELVTAAAGLDLRRGDTISVAAIAFARAPALKATSSHVELASFGGTLPIVVLAFAIVMGLGMVVRPLVADLTGAKRGTVVNVTEQVALTSPYAEHPERLYATLASEPPHVAAAVLSRLPAGTTAAVLEFYPPERRREIVSRLTRSVSPIARDASLLDASG